MTALYNTQTTQGDISGFTYVHDQAGNRLTVTSSWGTQTYAYDNIYQVTGVDYPPGYPFADKTYNYDPVGNRDSTVNGGTVDYQNNELNEYTTVGGTPFASDLRGNLTTDGAHVYQYDLENRLTAIDEDISYTYNPFGLRTGKTAGESSTQYILDDQREIEEWEGGELVRKYIYSVGIDEPLCMLQAAGSELYFYHFDALGSVHNLTDSTGATAATYKYDIYGSFSLAGSSNGNPYTFTARRYDPESGLYYYRARYYSIELGRFLQTDPVSLGNAPNLYTYVRNSIVNLIDIYGLYESYPTPPSPGPYPQPVPTPTPDPDGNKTDILNTILATIRNISSDVWGRITCGYNVYSDTKSVSIPTGYDDKWRHCFVACSIADQCGLVDASTLGTVKELVDLIPDWVIDYISSGSGLVSNDVASTISKLKGDPSVIDWWHNCLGMACANEGIDCDCCCRGISKHAPSE